MHQSLIHQEQQRRKRIEDGKPTQAVTLFALVGVAEDLSKTQYLLCGEINEQLKLLKQSIAEIPFQKLSKQVQDLTKNLETRMCSLELTYKNSEGHYTAEDQTAVPLGFISSGEMEPI